MRDIQDIFNELEEIKKEQKAIRKDYRDMLTNDGEYQLRKDEYDTARITKKEMEVSIQDSMGGSYDRLEELKVERTALEEMLSDAAMTQLLKGESIELSDTHHNEYEPVYKVSFKKIG